MSDLWGQWNNKGLSSMQRKYYLTKDGKRHRVYSLVDFFFISPNVKLKKYFTQLYLLRRDLVDLTGNERKRPRKTDLKSPLLSSLAMMIGLELLAKFHSGKYYYPKFKQKHFKRFLREIGKLSNSEAQTLVQFRNAIAHGYCLETYEYDSNTDEIRNTIKFILDDKLSKNNRIFICVNGVHRINIWNLKSFFLRTIKIFKNELNKQQNTPMRDTFEEIYNHLGELKIVR